MFRDYPVNISKHFYYNLQDQNFYEPYSELSDAEKSNRKVRLNEIKEGYEFIQNFGTAKDNVDIVRSAFKTVQNKFRRSPEERAYILFGLELPE